MNIGDQITIGNYPQTENGDEKPIKWRVIAKSGNKALVLAQHALDCQPYNADFKPCSWESCSLRQWLNKDFYLNAFSETEKDRILYTYVPPDPNPKFDTEQGEATEDYVFLLSAEEAGLYFKNDKDRICMPTNYATKSGVWKWDDSGACDNWLRTTGGSKYGATDIIITGEIRYRGASVRGVSSGVRPAMVITDKK